MMMKYIVQILKSDLMLATRGNQRFYGFVYFFTTISLKVFLFHVLIEIKGSDDVISYNDVTHV